MHKTNTFSTTLFQLLNQRNIQYCVLRNYKSLPDNTGNSDLDLWISSSDIKNVSEILEETSLNTNCKIVSLLTINIVLNFVFKIQEKVFK